MVVVNFCMLNAVCLMLKNHQRPLIIKLTQGPVGPLKPVQPLRGR